MVPDHNITAMFISTMLSDVTASAPPSTNVVVDNSHTEGAPVVFESNPTFTNLVGRIERRAQFGAKQQFHLQDRQWLGLPGEQEHQRADLAD